MFTVKSCSILSWRSILAAWSFDKMDASLWFLCLCLPQVTSEKLALSIDPSQEGHF